MTANIKSDSLQVIEGTPVPGVTSVTNQAVMVQATSSYNVNGQIIMGQTAAPSITAPQKFLVLGPPSVNRIKSDTIQVLEGASTDLHVTAVTNQIAVTQAPSAFNVNAQVVYSETSNQKVTAPQKNLVLRPAITEDASSVKMEVIGQSSIIPPVPGQETVWFFN